MPGVWTTLQPTWPGEAHAGPTWAATAAGAARAAGIDSKDVNMCGFVNMYGGG